MIKSFASKETQKIFNRRFSRKLPPEIQDAAYRRLVYIEIAVDIQSLIAPPSNRLEKLSGDRKGQYSIRINNQWRICFNWEHGDAFNVEIIDYH